MINNIFPVSLNNSASDPLAEISTLIECGEMSVEEVETDLVESLEEENN